MRGLRLMGGVVLLLVASLMFLYAFVACAWQGEAGGNATVDVFGERMDADTAGLLFTVAAFPLALVPISLLRRR